MAYILLNKETKESFIFGTLPNVAKQSGIKYRKLQYEFATKKVEEFENETFRVIRKKK